MFLTVLYKNTVLYKSSSDLMLRQLKRKAFWLNQKPCYIMNFTRFMLTYSANFE